MRRIKIPRYINNPMQIFLWEIDQLLPFFGLLGVGIALKMSLMMFVLGIISAYYMGKVKDAKLRGFLTHFAYWNGVIALNKKFDNGWVREYVE